MTITTDREIDLLFGAGHTAYDFTDEPVSEDELRQLWDLVKWAPTAGNGQPMRVTFITSQAARDRLMPHVGEGNRSKLASAPVTAIISADSRWHELLPRLQPYATNPHLAWDKPEPRMHAARFNTTLQAGYLILGVRALGLSAGPMGGFDSAGVDAEFFPDGRLNSVLLVNIGHASAEGHRLRMPRLDFDDVATIL